MEERGDDAGSVSFRYVLLPLDGSAFALAALPTARALSARFGADLVTISVAADERDAGRLHRHAVESLGACDGGADRTHVVIGADPASTITARAAELGSCVVCMSTRGRGRVAGTVIGSVARAVLQSSRAPMVAVGPRADRPGVLVGRPRRRPASWPEPLSVPRLVACVDGSSASEAVLPVAARWARALDMHLAIVTVAEDVVATEGDAPAQTGSVLRAREGTWRSLPIGGRAGSPTPPGKWCLTQSAWLRGSGRTWPHNPPAWWLSRLTPEQVSLGCDWVPLRPTS